MPYDDELWTIHCFGGPLHGQETGARERDTSFVASVPASTQLRLARTLRDINAVVSRRTVNYQIVTNSMADGLSLHQVKCALAEGITRDHLIEYRDFLHAELQRFREDNYRANVPRRY